MYINFDEEKLRTIEKITFTNYRDDNFKNLVSVENIECIIDDLLLEIDRLEEQKKDMERDIEDNYKLISKEEQYCWSEKDFI